MSKKRIVMVEDEKDMADLVAKRLRREGYDIAVVHDGADALHMILAEPPDMVLLDIMLPGISGTEIATQLRNDPRTTRLPIIMLTAKSEESDIVVGLKLGADDYVTKPFSMSVLIARMEARFRRQAAAPMSGGAIFRAGQLTIDHDQHRVKVAAQAVPLTLTEFRILTAIVAARGRVLNRNQLMDQVLGLNTIVNDRTIDVHVTTLRKKLGPARGCIRTVRGVGYQFDAEAAADHETP